LECWTGEQQRGDASVKNEEGSGDQTLSACTRSLPLAVLYR